MRTTKLSMACSWCTCPTAPQHASACPASFWARTSRATGEPPTTSQSWCSTTLARGWGVVWAVASRHSSHRTPSSEGGESSHFTTSEISSSSDIIGTSLRRETREQQQRQAVKTRSPKWRRQSSHDYRSWARGSRSSSSQCRRAPLTVRPESSNGLQSLTRTLQEENSVCEAAGRHGVWGARLFGVGPCYLLVTNRAGQRLRRCSHFRVGGLSCLQSQ
mmetsp:Transcript_7083/g.12123  ORF Transcript_7083/g.12123 Transcript_7083/m.12123 type:complete len:218 (-) Transcript_7083:452-1105(-)